MLNKDVRNFILQGGSNMPGTNCDLFTNKSFRSYLNHLVFYNVIDLGNFATHNFYFISDICTVHPEDGDRSHRNL
jgi:hypothetical protein